MRSNHFDFHPKELELIESASLLKRKIVKRSKLSACARGSVQLFAVWAQLSPGECCVVRVLGSRGMSAVNIHGWANTSPTSATKGTLHWMAERTSLSRAPRVS